MNDVIRKVRGKAVKPTMVYVSLRIDKEVYEYLNTYPNRSAKIREVLANFINKERGIKDEKSKQAVTEVK
jgi:metal-responsive CopG/Arc/MetJ family transcriptional regulator